MHVVDPLLRESFSRVEILFVRQKSGTERDVVKKTRFI